MPLKKTINQKKIVVSVPMEIIQNKIYFIRDKKVMLDRDLAELYGVETKRLKEQVKRNLRRFPDDFYFELNKKELVILRSQFATLKRGQHQKYLPYVFTEQGVAMLSSVLNSNRSIDVNIQIMRVFTKLRELMLTHHELARRIDGLEKKFQNKFKESDKKIMLIFNAIKDLLSDKEEANKKKGLMGFLV